MHLQFFFLIREKRSDHTNLSCLFQSGRLSRPIKKYHHGAKIKIRWAVLSVCDKTKQNKRAHLLEQITHTERESGCVKADRNKFKSRTHCCQCRRFVKCDPD